jgi:hypothetical protein
MFWDNPAHKHVGPVTELPFQSVIRHGDDRRKRKRYDVRLAVDVTGATPSHRLPVGLLISAPQVFGLRVRLLRAISGVRRFTAGNSLADPGRQHIAFLFDPDRGATSSAADGRGIRFRWPGGVAPAARPAAGNCATR